MKTLRSHVGGKYHEASDGFADLVDPSTEEVIARASSAGIDFRAAVEFARKKGRAALAELTIGGRGGLLKQMAGALHEHRDELLDISLRNNGATRKDAKFDVDGATFALSHYARMGEALGDARAFVDGEGMQLGRTARFWGQHVRVPLQGVAVHINAFNFPVWGWAEKAACALLAGIPVITKPATSTSLVAERSIEILIDAKVLPEGALSMICGSTGDLLDHLGPQDVLAFTGSADTGLKLRSRANLLLCSTRVNIEADSLNAAIVGPDVDTGETWDAFRREVAREITQKAGQKCTAVRRILVPEPLLARAQETLAESLEETVTGNPRDASVNMGPLATRQQLDDAVAGVAKLAEDAEIVFGSGERVDGAGSPAGVGYFFAPTLLRTGSGAAGGAVHQHEVFGPVATLIPYDGSAASAAEIVSRGGGSLVTSLYSDDETFVGDYIARGGSTSGRLYLGSEKVAAQLPGSGAALPGVLHGGPGRAGGGAELGGERGLALYLQDVALTGDRGMVERLAGTR